MSGWLSAHPVREGGRVGGGVGGSVVSILSHGVAAMFPRAAQDECDGGSSVMQQLWPQLIDTDVQPLISLLLCWGGLGGGGCCGCSWS